LALPAARLVRHDDLMTRTDTRTLGKAWIEARVPDGTSIAIEWPAHAPPLSGPGDPEPDSTRTYDVTALRGVGLQAHPASWYREQGIEYLVATSFIYSIPMRGAVENAERLAFYASLEREFELVQEFWPNETQTEPSFVLDEVFGPTVSLWQRDRPGPTLRIYRVSR
jgi:hypothetical protein